MSGQSTRDSKMCSKCNTTHQLKIAQLLAKNVTNVVLRTISARVADHHGATDKTPTDAEVEHQDAEGALRDAADPAEAGTPGPGQDQGAVHRLGTPTASR